MVQIDSHKQVYVSSYEARNSSSLVAWPLAHDQGVGAGIDAQMGTVSSSCAFHVVILDKLSRLIELARNISREQKKQTIQGLHVRTGLTYSRVSDNVSGR